MKNNEHTIGIDIGTHGIKIIITEEGSGQKPKILHALHSPTHGLRHGYIVDADRAYESLQTAINKTEREYKQPIRHARFSVSGIGLQSQYVRTSLENIRTQDIQDQHVDEVIQKAEELFSAKYPNKKILHIIPVKYQVDGRDVLGSPTGMYGTSLEVKVIFITILEHHYDSLISLIEKTGIKVTDIIASPLADAASGLNYKQQTQGSMVVNIGSETTSVSTYENGIITSLEILQIGSNDITNDIALGLQVPLSEAEKIKIGKNNNYPKRKVEEIIYARLADILELSDRALVKIKRNRLLPAGVVFTGGGSQINQIEEYTKQELKLPAELIQISKTSKKSNRSSRLVNEFSVAYGLCITDASNTTPSKRKFSLKNIKQHCKYWIDQIMP